MDCTGSGFYRTCVYRKWSKKEIVSTGSTYILTYMHMVQFIKTERFTPLLRTYVRVSFHLYSKSEPYYEFSGSVFTKRVNEKSKGVLL